MANVSDLRIKIRFAWWWPLYSYGVLAMCYITRRMPDEDRLAYWCKRAIRIKYE